MKRPIKYIHSAAYFFSPLIIWFVVSVIELAKHERRMDSDHKKMNTEHRPGDKVSLNGSTIWLFNPASSPCPLVFL